MSYLVERDEYSEPSYLDEEEGPELSPFGRRVWAALNDPEASVFVAYEEVCRRPLDFKPWEVINGATAEARFKAAVAYLWGHGIYPGPTVLNDYLHGRDSDNLNGRESKWRREVMAELDIPFQRPRQSFHARRQMRGMLTGV